MKSAQPDFAFLDDSLDGVRALMGHYLAAHYAALSMPFDHTDRPSAERAKWSLARELTRSLNRRDIPACLIHQGHTAYVDTNGELVVRPARKLAGRRGRPLGGKWVKVNAGHYGEVA